MANEYNTPQIEVGLTDSCEKGCTCGEPYCAIVMDYDEGIKGWFNTGIVCRATSPEKAFKEALDKYREDCAAVEFVKEPE